MNYLILEEICRKNKICIWGYGKMGKLYAFIPLMCAGARIECYCDSNYIENAQYKGIPLINQEVLLSRKDLFIFIAINDTQAQAAVSDILNNNSRDYSIIDFTELSSLCESIEKSHCEEVYKRYERLMDDSQYLDELYKYRFGRSIDFLSPKTFNEKLQWLKINDRNPKYTDMADKFKAKEYVKSKIGEDYVIPTYGLWESFDEIDFDKLPEKFVLKCTHDSGSAVFCNNHALINVEESRKKLKKALQTNFYWYGREWPYKDIKPCIIAEELLEDNEIGQIIDYKFFCFNGEVKAMFVASDRLDESKETKFDFFDAEFNHLNVINGHPNSTILPEKPKHFELMKELSASLSKGIPQIRVDFYECNGRVYFGELTFFHWSGLVPFEPNGWDDTFGSWIQL